MNENKKNIFQLMNPFISKLTSKFEENGFTSENHKKLIWWVHSFLRSRRCKKEDNNSYIYQYTNFNVLESIRKYRKLRLTPAIYMNDPEEGKVMFSYIKNIDNSETNISFINFIEKIQRHISDGTEYDTIAFIRSLSRNEDSMVMWNSSYGDNGAGAAIGMRTEKLNKGTGIFDEEEKLPKEILNNFIISQNQKEDIETLPIERTGLYEILYVDKQAQDEHEYILLEIKKCLKNIFEKMLLDSDDSKEKKIIPLLSELLSPISYMVKDTDWKHEEEYRLFYIGSIGEKCIKSNCESGLYIETEPFLFDTDDDKIYIGPKIDDIIFLKCIHNFKQNGLKVHIQRSESLLR
ncbi:MAG: DUF2971 domain-containing protein [Treponema sp.]|jgi:hypothetical protein|nr:DUF2971 domain-containing protein [Treponema sp.]